MRHKSAVAVVVLSALAVLALAAPAGATPLAGENGRIVLMSEQNNGLQKGELFLLPVPFDIGGGTLSPSLTNEPTLRHRHPTWSPDRTKIAYARGPSGGPFDIFVQDLTQPLSATNPVNITTSALNEDRPAWAPNGTHIAFERGAADREIVVSLTNGGGQINITQSAGIEGKPAWNPTSSTIYYEDGDAQTGAVNTNIVRRPISFPGGVPTVGAQTLAVADSGEPEIQPAISPDGQKICYGTGYPAAPGTEEIKVAALTGSPASGSQVSFTNPSYYCTWSPDSKMVAYTAGGGAAGDLVMVRADGSDPFETPLATGADIQTNADWAPDGRPECPNSSATATSGQAVTIPVECTDTGPQYERSEVKEFLSDAPDNGTAEQNLAGDPITYTPNANFVGIDFIEISSFDEFGFGGDEGTIAINVTAPGGGGGGGGGGTPETCFGSDATITGTDADDVIDGTDGDDVIAALGGNDRVRGRGGNDLICGNDGNDRANGGGGNDRVSGGAGNDRLGGGSGRDRLAGGPNRDRLTGGSGFDTCLGGTSRDTSSRSCDRTRSIP